MERIALISDMHGNLTALEAVLAELGVRGLDTIYNLGAVAGKGPRGSACAQIVRERRALTVRSNWDEFFSADVGGRAEADAWWHDELSEHDRGFLGALPLAHDVTIGGRVVRLFHAPAGERLHARPARPHSRSVRRDVLEH